MTPTRARVLILLTAALLAAACATPENPPVEWPDTTATVDHVSHHLVAGQPTADELEAAAAAGIMHVVNARAEGEFDEFDEAQIVNRLGMRYHHLPIAGPQDLTRQNVVQFDGLLARIGDQPAILHCASGNRIGALFALRAAWIHNMSIDEALAEGRRHGLTGLEPAVRRILEKQN